MKFIVDQQLPPDLVDWLIAKGHEAIHVFPLGLGEVADSTIWDLAIAEVAIVVTKDRDFAERRMREPFGPTILWIRIGNSATRHLLATLEDSWSFIEGRFGTDHVIEIR
ncbi:MAG: DUF5615 family PIN-like protein [Caulobacteraceae bacterium]